MCHGTYQIRQNSEPRFTKEAPYLFINGITEDKREISSTCFNSGTYTCYNAEGDPDIQKVSAKSVRMTEKE